MIGPVLLARLVRKVIGIQAGVGGEAVLTFSGRWSVAFNGMYSGKHTTVPHPDDAIEAILGNSAEVSKALPGGSATRAA